MRLSVRGSDRCNGRPPSPLPVSPARATGWRAGRCGPGIRGSGRAVDPTDPALQGGGDHREVSGPRWPIPVHTGCRPAGPGSVCRGIVDVGLRSSPILWSVRGLRSWRDPAGLPVERREGRQSGHLVQAALNGLRRPPCSDPCTAREDVPARCASCGLAAMQPLQVAPQGHECSCSPDRLGAPGGRTLGIPSLPRSSRWSPRAAGFAGDSVFAHPRSPSAGPGRILLRIMFGAALLARARETHPSRHPPDPSGRARCRSPRPPPPPPRLPAHLRRSFGHRRHGVQSARWRAISFDPCSWGITFSWYVRSEAARPPHGPSRGQRRPKHVEGTRGRLYSLLGTL